jgi:SAM-dependent methyltransferase
LVGGKGGGISVCPASPAPARVRTGVIDEKAGMLRRRAHGRKRMSDSSMEYWEQRLREGPKLENVGWIGLGRAFNEGMYRIRVATFLPRVKRALRTCGIDRRAARVLDIGSGSGFYIDLWKRLRVRELSGADITTAVVDSLRARYPDVPFRRIDISSRDVPLQRESLDAISCMDVLFHIMDDEGYRQAIENCASLLRRGGIFIFTENCLHRKRIGGPHQVSRSLEEIVALLHKAGFQVLARRPCFVLMNTPVDSENRILRALWRAIMALASRSERSARIVCAMLYAPERALVSLLREGPSTEMLICRKVS